MTPSTPPPSRVPDATSAELPELQSRCPLPAGATSLDVFSQSAAIGELQIDLVGLTAKLGGEVYAGSAGEVGASPMARAYFELVERLSIGRALNQEAPFVLQSATGEPLGYLSLQQVFPTSPEPTRWRYAKSNGVSLAATWAEACERAAAEAVERDCVLRAWHGEMTLDAAQLSANEANAWRKFDEFFELEFRAQQWLGHWVVVAAGFPKGRDVPFCIAFGARKQLDAALLSARKEFTQRFGFLYGESIPDSAPPLTPDANYHQEYSLWAGSHPELRAWLSRSCSGSSAGGASSAPQSSEPIGFVDLTPKELVNTVSVVRAWWPELRPLVFGAGYDGYPLTSPHPIA